MLSDAGSGSSPIVRPGDRPAGGGGSEESGRRHRPRRPPSRGEGGTGRAHSGVFPATPRNAPPGGGRRSRAAYDRSGLRKRTIGAGKIATGNGIASDTSFENNPEVTPPGGTARASTG